MGINRSLTFSTPSPKTLINLLLRVLTLQHQRAATSAALEPSLLLPDLLLAVPALPDPTR